VSALMPRWRASISVTISIDSSCVVNALVLATPISGPAWVIMPDCDSVRNSVLGGTTT
jgi:hypothetical protein